VAIWRKRWK